MLCFYSFDSNITRLEFSPNSRYILVVMCTANKIEVKSIEDKEWECRIGDPKAGIAFARWIPDSQQVMVICGFNLRATIYSLTDQKQYFIKNPKFADRGVSFNSTGQFMALAERKDAKDYVGIYYTRTWELVNVKITHSFPVLQSADQQFA